MAASRATITGLVAGAGGLAVLVMTFAIIAAFLFSFQHCLTASNPALGNITTAVAVIGATLAVLFVGVALRLTLIKNK